MNLDDFKQDIAATPFHIASIFDDPDDYLWVWQKLYTDICDAHAPIKEVRVRSESVPWISNNIRFRMNTRFKLQTSKLFVCKGRACITCKRSQPQMMSQSTTPTQWER